MSQIILYAIVVVLAVAVVLLAAAVSYLHHQHKKLVHAVSYAFSVCDQGHRSLTDANKEIINGFRQLCELLQKNIGTNGGIFADVFKSLNGLYKAMLIKDPNVSRH